MRPGPERLHISDKLGSIAIEALARCDEAATFTEEPGKITRTFLREPMRRLHGRLAGWMEAAGMRVRVDAAGNLIGRYDGLDPTSPVLMIGSHLDTVPDAGKYDGVLGVVLGVAAVQALGGRRLPFGDRRDRVLRGGGRPLPRARTWAAWRSAGRFDRRLLDRIDADGIAMADAFRTFGLDPARIAEAAYPAGRRARLP